MASCTVTMNVRTPDDAPDPGAIVWFSIDRESYTSASHYPRDTIKAVADVNGLITQALWVNETGIIPTKWWCRLPSGEKFSFSIPVGTTADTVEHLRGLSTPIPPSIAEATLGALIAAHNADPAAHPGLGGGGAAAGDLTLAPLTYAPSGSYTLPIVPADPASVQLFVNGAKQKYSLDYTITGTVLAWVSSSFTLTITDTIEAYL